MSSTFINVKRLQKPAWAIGIGLVAITIGGGIFYGLRQCTSILSAEVSVITLSTPQVVALGRLEPASEVISLAAPLALQSDRLAELRVKAGDAVEVQQVVAVLDSRDRLEKLLAEAQDQVQIAERKLAQVQAGAKQSEINSQRATVAQLQAELSGETRVQAAAIAKLQAELNNAQADFDRFESLYQAGAISASERDAKRLALQSAQAQLDEAKANQSRTADTLQAQIESARATLNQIAEVTPEDVALAQAEVAQSKTAAQVASAELEKAFVRASTAGRVLEILVRPGEQVSNGGIIEIGQTERMVVVAEVDESDIKQIKVGLPATITSEAFSGELRGQVIELGREVKRQSAFSDQPGADLDSRVVEARIELGQEDSRRVADFTNLQVTAAIQVAPSQARSLTD